MGPFASLPSFCSDLHPALDSTRRNSLEKNAPTLQLVATTTNGGGHLQASTSSSVVRQCYALTRTLFQWFVNTRFDSLPEPSHHNVHQQAKTPRETHSHCINCEGKLILIATFPVFYLEVIFSGGSNAPIAFDYWSRKY